MTGKILIFDYDGVIADSLDSAIRLTNNIFKKYGIKEVKNKEEFCEFFNNNFYDGVLEWGMPKERVEDMLEDFTERAKKEKILLFPGVGKMVKKLAINNKLFIVTSNTTETVKESLRRNCITEFNEILGADKERSKVKKITAIKKKYPDSEVYYIGDTRGDISDGKKANVRTIATTWGFHNRKTLEKENPDYIFDNIEGLVDFLA